MADSLSPLSHFPLVSVLLPVRNEEAYVEDCINSLLRQDYPPGQLEVFVADGQSTDRTQAIVRKIAEKDARVSLVTNPDRIMAAGFNRAFARSRGDLILMMGGHSILQPDHIFKCVSALHSVPEAGCVGGVTKAVALSEQAEAIAAGMRSRFGVGGAQFRTGVQTMKYVDTVAFGLYRRTVFEDVGLLDAALVRNQDDEFNYRLLDRGYRILILPDVIVEYTSRSSLNKLWRQYFEYGLWKVRVLQKHPGQMRPRHFAPPLLMGGLIGTGFLALVLPETAPLFYLTAGGYLVGNVMASILVAGRDGANMLGWLPLVFASLHWSYGLGFLAGIFRFWRTWSELIELGDEKRRKRP